MSNIVNINEIKADQLAALCDHTYLLPPEAFRHVITQGKSAVHFRREAFTHFLAETAAGSLKPYALCVPPSDVRAARTFLDEAGLGAVRLAATAGFPDGSQPTEFKVSEANLALDMGANEIDIVLNDLAYKAGDEALVIKDIESVARAVHAKGGLIKLILETASFELEAIERLCVMADSLGVDFVKTSTGFAAFGARVQEVSVMASTFPRGIKISGGVADHNVKELLKAAARSEMIELNPLKFRIGESSLLQSLAAS